MSSMDYNTGEYIIIYVYSLPHVTTHVGHVKIGKASIKLSDYGRSLDKEGAIKAAARDRIKGQLGTAEIHYDLEYCTLAIKDNGESFLDHDVHNVLKRSGISNIVHTEDKKHGEWFRASRETSIRAVDAVKRGYSALDASSVVNDGQVIDFRKGSQREAITKTIKAIEKGKKHFLWDAKMRFGKTLTSLEVVKQMKYGKTLIITHRPEVSDDWFKDFNVLFAGTDYRFGSRDKGERINHLQSSYLKGANGVQANPFVYFASIQYLRHEVKSAEKQAILSEEWDMLIIDEADEGIKTTLANEIISPIQRDFTLMLSGTPFNLLEDYKEDEIYSWDYTAEQELKARWDDLYPGEPNPYYKLPKLSILIYDLNKYIPNTQFKDLYDKAFNFKEFFRTDDTGEFVHGRYVKQFLDLIATKSDSNFPFSTEDFRNNLRHTLWMVPGVKEARALEKMLRDHPVFRNFNVANVAGDGSEEVVETKSRKLVKKAITDRPLESYSITISCGKMTRGVSVPEWSAVFMLSNTTSASTYLQTIFRGQTPWEIDGRLKTECFVFDFAPDRTLNVVAEVMNIKKKRPTAEEVKEATGKFLNFCPVISATDGEMKPFSAQKLLHAVKKVAIQKVTHNGFDDTRLYNIENLSNCTDEDLADFDSLNKIIGKSTGVKDDGKVKMADNGFTGEEREKAKKAAKKKQEKQPLTPEEEELLRRKREIAEQRKTRISILRGISIRMPMLIFGCKTYTDENGVVQEIQADSEISLEHFIEYVDDESWAEFMPDGVTKTMLREKFAKYYDDEVFIGAGIDIRLRALAADLLAPSERVMEIGEIFKGFKNPDKETVLTPWHVVNMHLSSTLGGSDFNDIIEFESEIDQKGEQIGLPKWVDQGDITRLWSDKDARVLDINSKSGLYPLLCAYNFYSQSLAEAVKGKSTAEEDIFNQLWSEVLSRNIYVLTKSPMAKTITERTLAGYTDARTNVVYIPELVSKLKDPNVSLISELSGLFSMKGEDDMKFDAVVGNPPYQETGDARDEPIYHLFYDAAEKIADRYSLISPGRFLFNAGQTPKQWNRKMLSDEHIKVSLYEQDSSKIFPKTDIKGGVAIIYRDKNQNFGSIGTFTHLPELNTIAKKVSSSTKGASFSELVQPQGIYRFSEKFFKTFPQAETMQGAGTKSKIVSKSFTEMDFAFLEHPANNDSVKMLGLVKGKRRYKWINKEYLSLPDSFETWRVILPESNGSGAIGEVLSTPLIGQPLIGHADTFLSVGQFDTEIEAENCMKYIKSKFTRTMLGILKITQHNSRSTWAKVPLQDFTASSDIDWGRSISEIDQQLYKKYALSQEEIDFIETRVKAME